MASLLEEGQILVFSPTEENAGARPETPIIENYCSINLPNVVEDAALVSPTPSQPEALGSIRLSIISQDEDELNRDRKDSLEKEEQNPEVYQTALTLLFKLKRNTSLEKFLSFRLEVKHLRESLDIEKARTLQQLIPKVKHGSRTLPYWFNNIKMNEANFAKQEIEFSNDFQTKLYNLYTKYLSPSGEMFLELNASYLTENNGGIFKLTDFEKLANAIVPMIENYDVVVKKLKYLSDLLSEIQSYSPKSSFFQKIDKKAVKENLATLKVFILETIKEEVFDDSLVAEAIRESHEKHLKLIKDNNGQKSKDTMALQLYMSLNYFSSLVLPSPTLKGLDSTNVVSALNSARASSIRV